MWPTAQTSFALEPQIETMGSLRTLVHVICAEDGPVPWKSPPSPPTQMSVGLLPHTAWRRSGIVECSVQALPSQRRMTPSVL